MKNLLSDYYSKFKWPFIPLFCLTLIGYSTNLQAQCLPPAGLTVVSQTTTTATLQWTSVNPPSVDHCWNIEVYAFDGGSGLCGAGQDVYLETICTFPQNGQPAATLVDPDTYQYTVTGLAPGTSYLWSLVETCDGALGTSGSCTSAIGPMFTTFDDPFVVTAIETNPSCPFISPGYEANGTISVSLLDGLSCPGTTYNITVTPVPNSGPFDSTPPATAPNTIFNATEALSPYFFASAGTGKYTVSVLETGACNPQINPEGIIASVPDATDNSDPVWQIGDVIGNVLTDNNIFTIPGLIANQGTINIPEGSCSFQQQLYASGFDLCDEFIVNPAAVSVVSNTTIPATIDPATQVSIIPDGFGEYLIDINWSIGTTTLVLEMCDAFGNCPDLTLIATVLDNSDPVLVCPTTVIKECVVGLDISPAACGEPAIVDNCDPEDVTLMSSDVTSPGNCPGNYTVTRSWTGTNSFGKSGQCTQVISVQDTQAPDLTCPGGMLVDCFADIPAPNPGAVTGTDACGTVQPAMTLLTEDNNGIGCPNDPFTRTYTYEAADECDNTSTCTQVITVIITEEPTITAVSPITFECYESINPVYSVTTGCNSALGYTVEVDGPHEAIDPNNCPGKTYSYTYTVTDACGKSASVDQTVLIDNDGPTMECPDDCEVLSCYDGDYNAVIEAWINTVTASSSCSDDLTVNNSFVELSGICVGDFTPVTFSAIDACERSVSCESGIFIIDTDAPEIYEQPSDELVPCTANTLTLFEEWLDSYGGAAAWDACGGPVSWSRDTESDALNCDGEPQMIIVTFTASDGCNNSVSVTGVFSTILLPNAVNVSGLIQTEAAEPVAAVEVAAYQSSGMAELNLSNLAGDYQFQELVYEDNTEIVPTKDNDYLNGVSTYDLIVLQQHILNIQELNSPYKKIAADANRSGTISTLDLVLLRRLILHIDEELADNTSWRFVDADFVFPNAENPFETEFPEIYELAGEEEEEASFIAVKIGDLNLSAETNNLSGNADDRSGLEDLVFEIEDQKLKAGEEYVIDVTAQNFVAIRGFQMTWDIDYSKVSVLEVESGALSDFSESNYNLALANEGKVPMSWHAQTGQDLSFGDVAPDDSPQANVRTEALRIIIKAKANVQLSEALSINSSLTKAEAYGTDLMNVSLNFINNGTSVAVNKFELYQNQPNPFKASTMIGFQLPEASEVTVEVFDVAGKRIHAQRGDFTAGYHQIDLDRANLQAGVLYYQVSTATDSDSKKMILID